MATLFADCPRCGVKHTTFDAISDTFIGLEYKWSSRFEVFSVCRSCHRSTVFVASLKEYNLKEKVNQNCGPVDFGDFTLNDFMRVERFVNIGDLCGAPVPDHLSEELQRAFSEGTACKAISCYNAAGTMFRLCLDHVTRPLLPLDDVEGLTPHIRRMLGARLTWLFRTDRLPASMKDLSDCVREDGNDGAHQGTLSSEDAEDLYEFTYALLDRLISEPARLNLAKERRAARRAGNLPPEA